MMDWTHLVVALLVLAVGVYIGAKNPGLVSKATGGALAA